MCTREALNALLLNLHGQLDVLFDGHLREVILFGSYARDEASEDSDVDILLLVDLPREKIPDYRRRVASVVSEYLFSDNLLFSPVIENADFFDLHRQALPFYRNIDREGVRIVA